jgi:hypothetical protein
MTKKRRIEDPNSTDTDHTVRASPDRKKTRENAQSTRVSHTSKSKTRRFETSSSEEVTDEPRIEYNPPDEFTSRSNDPEVKRFESKFDLDTLGIDVNNDEKTIRHGFQISYDTNDAPESNRITSDVVLSNRQIASSNALRHVALIDLKWRTSEDFTSRLRDAKSVSITISRFPSDTYDEIMDPDSLRGKQLTNKSHKRVYVTSDHVFKGPYGEQHATLKNIAFRSIVCNAMNLHIAYPSGFFRDPKNNIFVSYVNVASEVSVPFR